MDPSQGVDALFSDSEILKFLYAYNWDLPMVVEKLHYHLQWRQTMVPRPKLTNKLLELLNTGLLYIHGRAKDHSPILVLSFAPMGPLLRNKQINAAEFGALYNFYARYMINNMMVQGQ